MVIIAGVAVVIFAGAVYLEYGHGPAPERPVSGTSSVSDVRATGSQPSQPGGSTTSLEAYADESPQNQEEARAVNEETPSTKERALNGTFIIDGQKRNFDNGTFYNDGYSLQMLTDFLRVSDVDGDADNDVVVPVVGDKTRLALLRSFEGGFTPDLVSEVVIPGTVNEIRHLTIADNTVEVVAIKQSAGGEVPQLLTYAIRDEELVLKTTVQGEGEWTQFNNQALGLSFYHPETIDFDGRRDYPLGSSELRSTNLNFDTKSGRNLDVIISYDETPLSALQNFQNHQADNIVSSQEVSISGMDGYYLLRKMPGENGEVLHTYLLENGSDVMKVVIEAEVVKSPVLIVGALDRV